jgi:transmembrane sensor
MKKDDTNIEGKGLPEEIEVLIDNTHISWDRSKEQIWDKMEKKIETKDVVDIIYVSHPWLRVAIAALFSLLVGISALFVFYSTTINVPVGLHSEVYLPDKSLIKLNAQSTLTYKPFLWRFSRVVKFEGEAFFDVKKGKQFKVLSEKGKTVVLGTTFNIYSRDNEYKVTCITGKVSVKEPVSRQEVMLLPGQQSTLSEEDFLDVESGIDTEQTLSWVNDLLSFTSEPLERVFDEIGRQYGILIETDPDFGFVYTGTFLKDSSAANVLNLVCRPFNLKVVHKSENEYVITSNN